MPEARSAWSLTDVLASRPAIRVNQLGYLPGGPMGATIVSDDVDPVAFAVVAGDGAPVYHGASQPWPVRPEPTSGLAVHVLDFSGLRAQGNGFRIEARGACSHTFAIARDLYAPLARDALRFFYLQRSGCAIDESRAPGYGRPAGHAGRAPNRGDTEVPAWRGPEATRLYPGWECEGRFDVSGGWYDAGDYGKYVVSGGIAAWQLLATIDLLRRLDLASTSTAGMRAAVLEECRWQLDWMLRMRVPDGRPLAGMAFHRVHGTAWPPLPIWPHEDPTRRVLHRPSTAATLHLAAVAAQGARLFAAADAPYAARLGAAARAAYQAARSRPVLIAPDDRGAFGGGPYADAELADDFYWAAAELWLATGEAPYRADVLESEQHGADVFDPSGFDFAATAAAARLDLALVDSDLPDRDRVRATVRAAGERLIALQRHQPWGQPYAPPDGWDWGSNGRVLNNLVVLAGGHLVTGERRFRDAAVRGIDYLLGRNGLGQSYVTGYGTDDSRHQRTRCYAHDLDPAYPPVPAGAVAGGPNSKPHPGFPADPRLADLPPQCCYLDEPTSEVTNDVCIRWNAPLVWVATYLGGVTP
jgi:endoglucanase